MAVGKNNQYASTYNAVGLMYIEPTKPCTKTDDALTKRTQTFQKSLEESSLRYKGVHLCSCGKASGNFELLIKRRNNVTHVTNTLLTHYVESHREEIPADEMKELLMLLDKNEIK